MNTTRRDVFRGAIATGLTAGLPKMASAATTNVDPALKARYAKLDEAMARPVLSHRGAEFTAMLSADVGFLP